MVSNERVQQGQSASVQIVEGRDGILQFGRDWDDLFARASEVSPYLSRPWLSTFIREGNIAGTPIFVLGWSGPKLVALLALAVRKRLSIKMAEPIGTYLPSYLGLLLDVDYLGVVKDIADAILTRRIADVICIHDLSSIDRATNALLAELEKREFSVRRVSRNRCLIVRLGRSFDEYLRTSKSAKQRKKLRKEDRKLSKYGQVKLLRYEAAEISSELLARIAAIQEQSWMKRRGAPMLSQPFHQKLVLEMAEAGFGRVWLMTIDGEDAAFKYAIISHRRLYLHWTAFKLKYASCLSVGKVLTQASIRDACDDGITAVDFGHGDAPHKRYWATDFYEVDRAAAGHGFVGGLVVLGLAVFWRSARQPWLRAQYGRVRRRLLTARGSPASTRPHMGESRYQT